MSTKRIPAPDQIDEETIPTNPEDRDPAYIWCDLTTPIMGMGEMVSVLKLRKPTGADLIRVGNPISFDPISDPPKISFDYPLLCKMIARLANIPSSSMDKMDPSDLTGIGWSLAPFFLPKPGSV